MKPLIDQTFWSDPDIENSQAGVKLAALWLITNTQTSLLGLCGASESRFRFETGLPAESLTGALAHLPRMFQRIGNFIFVRNYIRHQFGVGERLVRNNFFIALCAQFRALKDETLRAAVLAEYPEFHAALQTPAEQRPTKPSKALPQPSEGLARSSFPEGHGKPSQGLTKPKDRKEGKEGIGKESTGPAFDAFWAAYPRKVAKGNAERAWIAAGGDALAPQIMATLERMKVSADWTRDGAAFIPHPATWLNRQGWEDDPAPAPAPATGPAGSTGGSATAAAATKEDPATWRDFLHSLGSDYREFRYAPGFLKTDFHAWQKDRPTAASPPHPDAREYAADSADAAAHAEAHTHAQP